jgi:molybdate transport system substrate-binding protein
MMSRSIASFALLLFVSFTACGTSSAPSGKEPVQPGNLTVFAASSLSQAFPKIGALFERQHAGSKVRFNFSASDTLATQITQGAPADVFASASATPMDTISSASLTQSAPKLFASNKLLIITPRGNPAAIRSLRDLAIDGVKVVLAAPGVPAGDYARQVLDELGIRKEVEKNVVSNEVDDRSVVSKILFGDADAGIVYVTDLTPDVAPRLMGIRIATRDNLIAHYPIVALKDGPEPAAARRFVDLVLSSAGQKILDGFGFGPP